MRQNREADAPLFRDPIFDGAADPTIIWNPMEKQWWIFYTNRRAGVVASRGVSYCFGSDIGIASSADGFDWRYRGTAQGLAFEPGHNTFWAPEVIYAQGQYHMYCSYIRGISHHWVNKSCIIHYTSSDLWNWHYESILPLASTNVIDACVYEVAPNLWKMWYKDEQGGSHTLAAESSDLFHWTLLGPEVTDCSHEGPNVFTFRGKKWMIVDFWNGQAIYQSPDFCQWERKNVILQEAGTRLDDGTIGNHGDVLVTGDRAYIFYFTHPEMSKQEREDSNFVTEYCHRRTSLQVAELMYQEDNLHCNRNQVELVLVPPTKD